jgi:hypothetical protein
MKQIISAAILGAAMFAGSASAQSFDRQHFYVGGHLGQAKAKSACDGISGGGITCDDTDTSWKILGGYQFNKTSPRNSVTSTSVR